MIISIGGIDMKVARYNSLPELEDALSTCEAGSIFAGQKRDMENAWNMVAVTDADTGEYFGIGLLTASLDDPHLLVLNNGLLFIGADSFAIAFDIYTKQVKTLMPLPSEFVDFIYLENKKLVLIVHKKGVVAKDEDCNELWRSSQGYITGYTVDGDLFIMERANGGEVALKLKNGKEVELGR